MFLFVILVKLGSEKLKRIYTIPIVTLLILAIQRTLPFSRTQRGDGMLRQKKVTKSISYLDGVLFSQECFTIFFSFPTPTNFNSG